jgi:hypothetical protein
MNKILFLILGSSLIFLSCEKVITVDLNDSDPQIVIEGTVNNQAGPYEVRVSKTRNFNENIPFYGISGALVIISDNSGQVDTLTEIFTGIYKTTSLTGVSGNIYYLKVDVENKSYFAASFLPYSVNFDSLYTETSVFFGETQTYAVPKYRDTPGIRNFYRFVEFVNNNRTNRIFIQNDINRDGSILTQPLRSEDDILAGDTVTIEMMCIDEPVYNYFLSLLNNVEGGLNEGTPANPLTNIAGSKLGYFSAYSIQTKSIIVR